MSWPVRRLKTLADVSVSTVDKLTVDGQIPVRLCNYTDVYSGRDIRDDRPYMAATATAGQLRRFRLQVGQTVITKDSETADDIGAPAFVAENSPDLVCGYHLALLTPRLSEVHPRYIYWAVASNYCREQLSAAALGVTRFGLRLDTIEGLVVPVPPLDEQRRIVEYLDRETRRIDSAIAKRGRMLGLLERRSVALAAEVISGSNLSTRQPVERAGWLPPIPADWGWSPVSAHFQVTLGRMLNAARAVSGTLKPYVRNVNVRWDCVDVSDVAVMDFPPQEQARYRLRPGDLLVNEGGAGVGRAAIWEGQLEECYFQKSVLRLRPLHEVNPRWFVECMRVAVAQRVALVEGNVSTIPHLPAELIRVLRFPFPRRDVQDSQLAWLDRHRRRDTRLRVALERQIDLSNEHRTSLIASAVTLGAEAV